MCNDVNAQIDEMRQKYSNLQVIIIYCHGRTNQIYVDNTEIAIHDVLIKLNEVESLELCLVSACDVFMRVSLDRVEQYCLHYSVVGNKGNAFSNIFERDFLEVVFQLDVGGCYKLNHDWLKTKLQEVVDGGEHIAVYNGLKVTSKVQKTHHTIF